MRKRTPNSTDVKLSPSVSRDTWRRLKDRAAEENRSLNDLLNEWISEKLGDTPPPKQERRVLAPA